MGCIKSNSLIKIKTIEKVKNDVIEQNKKISTYISSSECGSSLKEEEIPKTNKISKIENDSKKIKDKE